MEQCPKQSNSSNYCYNCGKRGHSLKMCKIPKKGDGLSFVKCFICNETGHIAGKCPKNEKGIYKYGGECHK